MLSPFGTARLLLLLLVALPALALDPARGLTQYGLSVWRGEDGLPQGSVVAMTQTPDGYLWFATAEGLARFDGVSFTRFDRKNTAALEKTRHIGALLTSPDGSLWIGRGNGLARYFNGSFTSYPATALSDSFIWSLASGKDGSLWIGTYTGGLNRFHGGKFGVEVKGSSTSAGAIWATYVSHDGAVWMGTNGLGLTRLAGTTSTTFTTRDGLANDIVWAIHQDRAGAMWVGTNGGLNRIRDGRITTFTTADGLSNNCVKAILQDRHGNLWIGTEGGGLNRYSGGKFHSISVEQGFPDTSVLSLFEDREGSLWVGTTGGVAQLREDRIVTITRGEGLAGDVVWGLKEAKDGSLLIATNDGFSRWKDGKAMNLTTKQGLSSNVVRSVLEDRSGGIWLATNDGLNHWRDGKVTVYRTSDGLPHDMVRTVDEDRQGNVWIGTRGGGLARFRNGTFTVFNSKSGLAGDTISSVDEDMDGSLWIATTRGLSVFRDGTFHNYGPAQGVSNYVRNTHHDRDGAHWIGTYGAGLIRMKNGRRVVITAQNGLFDDVILSILEDDAGYLWMSSNLGIFRVKKKELDDFAEGRRSAVRSESFGVADGMKNAECNGGSPSAWKGSDGRLYFPTSRGVAVVDPNGVRSSSRLAVWNEGVLINETPVDIGRPISVDPQRRSLEIRYTAITFIAPKKVAFRYRLKGFSDEWVEAGSRRSAFYTNLPPGRYTFELMARSSDGLWHRARNPIAFHVRAAFHQTYWFYAAALALLVLVVGAGFRVRLRMVERREQTLVERVNEQTSLLSLAARRKQLILNSAGEGIFGLDLRGVATFINPAAARMLGWSVDELVGRDLHELTHGARQAAVECRICGASMDTPIRGPLQMEFRRRNGESVPVECTASTIVAEDGTPSGVVVTVRDVTERKAIELMKDEFVSTVSHELRTPLTSIRGALGLLQTGKLGTLSEKGRRMLDIANDNVARLVRLVNDILDLERLTSGRMTLSCNSLSSEELIRSSCDTVEAMAEQAGVVVVAQEPVLAHVWADPDRIGQVLTNLLSNAIKFSPRGQTVTIGAITGERHCTFRIEDRGRGVPADKFELIFERFKQVDASDSRDKGGSGLGLAICRSIVDLHGGRIWVESGVDGGAVFQFTVPLATPLDATA